MRLRRALFPAIAATCLLFSIGTNPAEGSSSPAPQQQRSGKSKPKSKQKTQGETEADRVVQDSELQARLAQERQELLEEHFLVCDLDENGWISFREASTVLGISRKEFRRYDTDGDGDIDAEEFRERARTILGLLGAFPTPKAEGGDNARTPNTKKSTRPPAITVEILLERFDGDVSGSLSLTELKKLFDLAEADLSPELISERMDPNGSGALEANELRPVATLLTELRLELPPPSTLGDNPDGTPNFEDLYRPTRESERPTKVSSGPPRIRGPISHFRRLDLWNDGYIDENDLRQLIAPARVEVRVAAILSALDTDGDNRLSQDEFRTALTGR